MEYESKMNQLLELADFKFFLMTCYSWKQKISAHKLTFKIEILELSFFLSH